MSNKSWTDEQLRQAVIDSQTLSQVARRLGLSNFGANSKTIKKYITKLNLDTSHFLSKGEVLKQARSKKEKLSHEQIFNINNLDRKYVKTIILRDKLLPYKCEICGITEWNGQKLSLHLDHINGTNTDNRLENLRFMCPNCHSLTDSYCGKRLKDRKTVDNNKCIDCDKDIWASSKRCKQCVKAHTKTKIDWPNTLVLIEMVKELGYRGTAQKLNVSDNAVKKRIKNHPDTTISSFS